MILNVIISDNAKSDLLEIRDYIKKDSPKAAEKFTIGIIETLDLLAEYPRIGRMRTDLTKKKYVLFWPSEGVLVAYKIKNNKLHVLRFINHYRNVKNLL